MNADNLSFDKHGLPYKQEDNHKEALKLLSIYFANIYCYKLIKDLEFKENHPMRERLPAEPLDEYDGYMTAHLNAYHDLLQSSNLDYLQDTDLHFYNKISILLYNNKLQIHPVAHYRQIDNNNLFAAMCTLSIFHFDQVFTKQDVGYNFAMKSLLLRRKSKVYNILGDLAVLITILSDVDNKGLYLLATSKTKTIFNKAALWLYLKRKSFGGLWEQTIKVLRG